MKLMKNVFVLKLEIINGDDDDDDDDDDIDENGYYNQWKFKTYIFCFEASNNLINNMEESKFERRII